MDVQLHYLVAVQEKHGNPYLRIYQPISTAQKFDLEQKFKDCKLEKETKHPDDWFTELDQIRHFLRTDHQFIITDDQLVQHIIYNIQPKAYDTTIYTLKRDLMYNLQVLITLERLIDEIRQVYGETSKQKTPEKALTAGKLNEKFKGAFVEQKGTKRKTVGIMMKLNLNAQHGV
jgi:hypothetical protein